MTRYEKLVEQTGRRNWIRKTARNRDNRAALEVLGQDEAEAVALVAAWKADEKWKGKDSQPTEEYRAFCARAVHNALLNAMRAELRRQEREQSLASTAPDQVGAYHKTNDDRSSPRMNGPNRSWEISQAQGPEEEAMEKEELKLSGGGLDLEALRGLLDGPGVEPWERQAARRLMSGCGLYRAATEAGRPVREVRESMARLLEQAGA